MITPKCDSLLLNLRIGLSSGSAIAIRFWRSTWLWYAMAKDMGTNVARAIKFAEKVLLVGIALLTVFATLEEIWQIYLKGSVQLADLLLLFIFTEVLGMIVFSSWATYSNHTSNFHCHDSYCKTDYIAGQRYGYDFLTVWSWCDFHTYTCCVSATV